MRFTHQSMILGYVGFALLVAIGLVIVLWWGSRLSREKRAGVFFKVLHLDGLISFLMRHIGRG